MKKIVFVIFFIFNGIVSTNGQEKETYTLIVKISGLKSNKGHILAGVYNSEIDFLKNEYKGDVVEIKEKRVAIERRKKIN